MASLTPRDHTRLTLERMGIASSIPGNLDRNKDAEDDDYGRARAGGSDSSSFKFGGKAKAPHMGRPGRQAGGRISGTLHRTRRTPSETESDIASEDALVNSLAKDRGPKDVKDMTLSKRIGRAAGGGVDESAPDFGSGAGRAGRGAATADAISTVRERSEGPNLKTPARFYEPPRDDRARGGRTKGKTTVNVIIGGQKAGPAMPPMMPPPPQAAPGPAPPPPRPPAPAPGMMPMPMPVGGAPMGAAGAPPPGAMPMRARGGRIEIEKAGKHDYGKAGVHSFGKGGTKGGATVKETYGAGGGLGRQEKARREK